ncbi:hypothetical protein HUN59_05310 [Curtobacterium sp. Csp2]|uniref:hypothetical protein n=1 Tax=Curtobacterium sp. Csp2 TaxID=2495430 RepID=UPI0015803953|nr:hypothetical protein [Curtobacterium sp. Csp2]QKS15715.1 hypothetical protein HUN59_05310 [Curtobacterium sp. Csp2]
MTDPQIAFESQDCTFVMYFDGSWDAYDDEGQRIYGGAFTSLDLRELDELLPELQVRRSQWIANDRTGEQ